MPKIAYSKIQTHKKNIDISFEDSCTSYSTDNERKVSRNIGVFFEKIEGYLHDEECGEIVRKYRKRLGLMKDEHYEETPYL